LLQRLRQPAAHLVQHPGESALRAASELRPATEPAHVLGRAVGHTPRRDLADSGSRDRNPRQRRAGLRLPDEQRRRAGPRPAQCQRPRQPHEGFVRPVPVAAARRLGLRLRLRQRGDRQNTAVGIGNTNAPLAPNNPIPADRPFHSLSYPDINYTIMRPAALPPSLYTDPQLPTPPPSSPPLTTAWPPSSYPGTLIGDPGVRNPLIYEGYLTAASASPVGTTPASTPASQLLVPPAIPVRRLFQPPDASHPP